MKKFNPDEIICVIDSNRGVYAPRKFIEAYQNDLKSENYTLSDLKECIDNVLQGPYNDSYWESWNDIVTNCTVISGGKRYTIYESLDVFLIPEDMELPEDF